jgi:hypothetical protein
VRLKARQFLPVFLASLLLILLFLRLGFFVKESPRLENLDVFVGVDAAYDDVEGVERLVDEVKPYTNLFVIGSTGITWNVTKLDQVCQYAYDSGLFFIVYLHPTAEFSQAQWIENARQQWGAWFLGMYVYDEVGGNQIDRSPYQLVKEASNYTDAANKYVESLAHATEYYKSLSNFPLFTADYALYSFDYKAGYDVVLAEFGWNQSRLLNVALCRGAATFRNKNWGVMVTWTYNNSPYVESGDKLYNDMVLAYNAGAKYVVVFNYPKVSTYGILEEEHFEALKKFWYYINHNSRVIDSMSDKVAYVLPKDYGYGFRGPNDKIWGLWESDKLSNKIWNDVNILLEKYSLKIDIVYEDGIDHNGTSRYSKLMFWNGT